MRGGVSAGAEEEPCAAGCCGASGREEAAAEESLGGGCGWSIGCAGGRTSSLADDAADRAEAVGAVSAKREWRGGEPARSSCRSSGLSSGPADASRDGERRTATTGRLPLPLVGAAWAAPWAVP